MTQEEKQLLLVDLCGRLPYKVWAQYYDVEDERYENAIIEGIYTTNSIPEILIDQYGLFIEKVKPYLRPMSSITDEEKREYKTYFNSIEWKLIGIKGRTIWLIDWHNAHHFDYRGLIEKGLALEAPEGMYEKGGEEWD